MLIISTPLLVSSVNQEFASGQLLVGSGCVAGENKVPSFDRFVARKAGFGRRLVDRFAICKLSEAPASGGGVFLRVLYHELNVNGRPRDERLFTPKHFIVFLGWNVAPGQPGNN